MAINLKEGFENIDEKLIEMGRSFKFSKLKIVTNIIIPSLKADFRSGLILIMGLGWKIVIMSEVLCASSGLGSQIADAKVNLQTDRILPTVPNDRITAF
jgi:ABC-type nitrate/sulfonate/bicarbonate transport system permease component